MVYGDLRVVSRRPPDHTHAPSSWLGGAFYAFISTAILLIAALEQAPANLVHLATLAGAGPLHAPPDKLLQGPIADAIHHVGQLAMLRRLAGTPIRGENYFAADVATGRVGKEQAPPRFEFD